MIDALSSAFANVSLAQLVLVAGVGLFASVVGGVTGYGSGALMPLVLVPMLGPEPVVPIIAISALLTNTWRASAFRQSVDVRRGLLISVAAIPTCMLSAYGYTLLTGNGAMFLIGGVLMLTVPLRYLLKRRSIQLSSRGLVFSAAGYGAAAGGTVGAGVILLSILMATGLSGVGVIATDALISIVIGSVRFAVFGVAGVVDAQVIAFALLIGSITFPGAFLAKALVERLPLHVHTAMLDVVVLFGGGVMVFRALTR